MLIYRLLNLLNDAVYLYTILLVIYALLSWFPGGYQSAFGKFLSRICEPYLSLFDRLNLRFGPIDLTIMVAVIILNLASQGLTMIIVSLL
ncbi:MULTISPECIES: YggT family protein [Enterococcus]|uniref:YggT family protein n=1 Tax=Enterococcus TaxID=1350 RepID=UPI0009E3E3C3|nr:MULTISPECIES: YggT family protein [Enterococcus]ASZ07980.1 YggT family protein [Enterococcus thailandicus]MDK4351732.1 YggT family protein [Enterococcus thailandicus]MDT2734335.1 YggT family protein [Enterococcus thailandicus]MDT2752390.1 YggT family protein [Enterococcus thailandicus]MDT2776885.1 YggT family protein [Enterococcus thailandicus]